MVLTVTDQGGRSLDVRCDEHLLLTYVYAPDDPQLESPRPYFHPVRTLAGDEISLYRPHDHVWHKGIAWSLPNVGTENFWGGPTYLRGRGYEQLPNNGTVAHRAFEWMTVTTARIEVGERLDWITAGGDVWFDETRSFAVALIDATAWVLTFTTRMTNVSPHPIVIGSPTTEGRDNAGYGGLFWRAPRSFTGGTVYAPGVAGGDELMGIRGDWLGFAGLHEQAGSLDASRPRPAQFDDGGGRRSTVVFVDAFDNPESPTRWFVRTQPYACLCPAPFFSTEVPVAPAATLELRYAVAIADGDAGPDGAQRLADAGHNAITTWRQQ
jgi:hypothetical protein